MIILVLRKMGRKDRCLTSGGAQLPKSGRSSVPFQRQKTE
jgi:hypothetical protein